MGVTWRHVFKRACVLVVPHDATNLRLLLVSLCQDAPPPSPARSNASSAPCPPETCRSFRRVHIGPRVVFVDREASRELNHLIMVPCHGVTVTESLEGADSRDADWFLLDYQKNKDVPRALVGHIQGGVDELDADENSLLLFSGESSTYHSTDPIFCNSG